MAQTAHKKAIPAALPASLKAALVTALVAGTGLLTACGEKPEDRQVAAGLACLDSASTTADANTCLDKVQGLETPQSYLIRCSANFIAQGVTGKRLADAFQKMKDGNPSGASSPTTALMGYMVFRSDGDYSRHTAPIAYDNCKASGVSSMLGLASIAKTAYAVTGVITPGTPLDPTSPNFDPNALKAKIVSAANANNVDTNTAVGQLAQTAQSVYCGTGSGFNSQDLCQKLNSAIAGGNGNSASIGYQLLGLLSQ